MTRSLVLLTLLGLLAGPLTAHCSGGDHSSLLLDVELDPAQNSLSAVATIRFSPELAASASVFYLHGELVVDAVTLNGQPVPFRSKSVLYESDYSMVARKITIDKGNLPADAVLSVTYSGHFSPSSARSPSDYMKIGPEGVFLRAYRYSLWFPVFLESGRDSYLVDFEMVKFRIPDDYTLVFVGEKLNEETANGFTTSTWTVNDAPIHDLQITARKFQVLTRGNVAVYHLDAEASRSAADSIADLSTELLRYYAANYRDNSNISSVNVLEMPQYGDISAGNMIGISSETFRAFREEDYPKRTIAHELVHPFVAVPVKRADAVYSLAVEGFPSYFHLLALSEIDGSDAYDDFLRRVEHWYVQNKGASEDQRGNTHPPEIPLLEISAEQLSEYKDGYILWGRSKLFFNYLLRHMGGKDFARFAKTLFSRDSLTEESFVALCNQFLPGQEDQVHDWLYTNAYPENFRLIDSQQQ